MNQLQQELLLGFPHGQTSRVYRLKIQESFSSKIGFFFFIFILGTTTSEYPS
jgi:hypothetical protein